MAYELARRLEQAGEEVKLVLFDTANPITAESGRLSLPGRLGAGWRMHGDRSMMARMGKLGTRLVSGAKSKRHHLNRLARCELLWREGRLDDLDDRLFFLNELHARLIQDFIPQGRVSNALLVRSVAPNDLAVLPWDYGWTEALVSNLTIAEVPVTHLDLFVPEGIEAMHGAVIDFLE